METTPVPSTTSSEKIITVESTPVETTTRSTGSSSVISTKIPLTEEGKYLINYTKFNEVDVVWLYIVEHIQAVFVPSSIF